MSECRHPEDRATRMERARGLRKPPPHGTLDEQNRYYSQRAHERWVEKKFAAPKKKEKAS